MKYYSQKDEQKYIVEYFKGKKDGKFIDIGAYHVERFSNTRKLYLNGWSGILVEPAPENFEALAFYYEGVERITVLNFAIGETTGEIDFYSCQDAVSTSDVEHMKKWEAAGVPYEKIKVQQVSVKDFMSEYCKDVDFISIDTEATNIIVFRNIPEFVFIQIKMICIEHDNNIEEIEENLSKYGFTTRYISSENIILAK